MLERHIEFSAVTTTSIYNVREDNNGPHRIYVINKIRAKSAKTTHVGSMFFSSTFLAISATRGIFPYTKEMCAPRIGEKTNDLMPDNVPDCMRLNVPHTSHLVALFFLEANAHTCFESSHKNIYEWETYTAQVLRTIKDDEIIRVSHFPTDFFEE